MIYKIVYETYLRLGTVTRTANACKLSIQQVVDIVLAYEYKLQEEAK